MSAPMLNIAIAAAREAGDIIVRRMDRVSSMQVDIKGQNDFVSAVDHAAEQSILEAIYKAYPQHEILAEESGAFGQHAYQWIIDPLDGTTNYLHGCPQFAVSIAVRHRDRIIHGVVYDPLRQEMFSASRGYGARLNDRRIRVGRQRYLAQALLGTGLPFRNLERRLDSCLSTLGTMCSTAAGVRCFSAASLDLAWVACGRLDGFWECELQPWDMAAGLLLIRESGGMATTLRQREDCLQSGEVVAGNPDVHGQLCKCLRDCMDGGAPRGARAAAAQGGRPGGARR